MEPVESFGTNGVALDLIWSWEQSRKNYSNSAPPSLTLNRNGTEEESGGGVRGGVFNQQHPRVIITSHPSDREHAGRNSKPLPCSLEGSELQSQTLETFCHYKKEKRKVWGQPREQEAREGLWLAACRSSLGCCYLYLKQGKQRYVIDCVCEDFRAAVMQLDCGVCDPELDAAQNSGWIRVPQVVKK